MSNKPPNPNWLTIFVQFLIKYRYGVSFLVGIIIIGLWFFLYFIKHWNAKDGAQVCTGFFIVITLLFAALNFEFSNSKMQSDYRAAKELLTFNTASEWHKAPIKDYQRISIGFENKFISSKHKRLVADFEAFIDNSENLEYRESLKGILNYFESSSIAAHRGLIDKSFISEFFAHIYKIYYKDYFFILRNNDL